MIYFNALKKCLEIARSETLVVASLNDLDEDRGTVLDGLGEYLQEVSVVIVVDKNFQLLQSFKVLLDLDFRVS